VVGFVLVTIGVFSVVKMINFIYWLEQEQWPIAFYLEIISLRILMIFTKIIIFSSCLLLLFPLSLCFAHYFWCKHLLPFFLFLFQFTYPLSKFITVYFFWEIFENLHIDGNYIIILLNSSFKFVESFKQHSLIDMWQQ
jgi:hypothetical protein